MVASTSELGPAAVCPQDFTRFVAAVEPRLRRALMATYGPARGREATAEALAWAWEHRDRLEELTNPVAYLYRVGRSRTRPRLRTFLPDPPEAHHELWVEPELLGALKALTERQRVAVVLVHGYGWSLVEVGALLDLKATTVQNHVQRGLERLRRRLEVGDGD